jgi:hypothetical protein
MSGAKTPRVIVGILVSAYAAHALVGLLGVGGQSHPQGVTFWPPWTIASGTYASAAVLGAMLLGGIATALNSRLGMRVLFWTFVASIAGEVLFIWPTAVALAMGWIAAGPSSHGVAQVDFDRYLRIGGWVALSGSVLTVLVALAAAVWVRREAARTAPQALP